PRQRETRPEAIGKPSARSPEEGRREREGPEDEPHLAVRETQVGTDRRRRRRDADAVEIGDRGDGERPCHDEVPGSGGRVGHGWPLIPERSAWGPTELAARALLPGGVAPRPRH